MITITKKIQNYIKIHKFYITHTRTHTHILIVRIHDVQDTPVKRSNSWGG